MWVEITGLAVALAIPVVCTVLEWRGKRPRRRSATTTFSAVIPINYTGKVVKGSDGSLYVCATVVPPCETCSGTGIIEQEAQQGVHVEPFVTCPDCEEKEASA